MTINNIDTKKINKHSICFVLGIIILIIFSGIAASKEEILLENLRPIQTIYGSDNNTTFEVAFSPNQGATELIIATIRNANKSVYVAAYCFTSIPIAKELIEAKKRGIDVKIIFDKKQNKDKNSLFKYLKSQNVPAKISYKYSIMHNKFIIIDNHTLQLGSFNYTKSAEVRNSENVLVIHNCPNLVGIYSREWNKLWNEAE